MAKKVLLNKKKIKRAHADAVRTLKRSLRPGYAMLEFETEAKDCFFIIFVSAKQGEPEGLSNIIKRGDVVYLDTAYYFADTYSEAFDKFIEDRDRVLDIARFTAQNPVVCFLPHDIVNLFKILRDGTQDVDLRNKDWGLSGYRLVLERYGLDKEEYDHPRKLPKAYLGEAQHYLNWLIKEGIVVQSSVTYGFFLRHKMQGLMKELGISYLPIRRFK